MEQSILGINIVLDVDSSGLLIKTIGTKVNAAITPRFVANKLRGNLFKNLRKFFTKNQNVSKK